MDFGLAQYVQQGVDELHQDQLAPLLKLKYRNALADALAELGSPGPAVKQWLVQRRA